jgi:hypothetical protein
MLLRDSWLVYIHLALWWLLWSYFLQLFPRSCVVSVSIRATSSSFSAYASSSAAGYSSSRESRVSTATSKTPSSTIGSAITSSSLDVEDLTEEEEGEDFKEEEEEDDDDELLLELSELVESECLR